MNRRTRLSIIAGVVVVAAAAVIVPTVVGAASQTTTNGTASVTPDPVYLNSTSCPGSATSLRAITVAVSGVAAGKTADASGPGLSGTQSISLSGSPQSGSIVIPAGVNFGCTATTATYIVRICNNGPCTGAGSSTFNLAVVLSRNAVTSSVSPTAVQVQCDAGQTTGQPVSPVTFTANFNAAVEAVTDAVLQAGNGVPSAQILTRAANSYTIPTSSKTVPCSGTRTYTINARQSGTTVETDTVSVTYTSIACPSAGTCTP